MKTTLFIITLLLASALFITHRYTAIQQYKNTEIQRQLLTRLKNANALINDFAMLPTECQEEYKLIIKHFKKPC